MRSKFFLSHLLGLTSTFGSALRAGARHGAAGGTARGAADRGVLDDQEIGWFLFCLGRRVGERVNFYILFQS